LKGTQEIQNAVADWDINLLMWDKKQTGFVMGLSTNQPNRRRKNDKVAQRKKAVCNAVAVSGE